MALPYAWGDSCKVALAHVNVQRTTISSEVHLDTALRDLHDPNRVRKTRLMPCALINPTAEKKVHQVANMDEVYKTAARMITYLGRLASKADMALEQVRQRQWGSIITQESSYAAIIKETEQDLLARTRFRREVRLVSRVH